MSWLKSRLGEPTTYIGLALLMQGAGVLGKINEMPVIADTVTKAAEPLAHGDYASAVTLVLGGLLGVFMREKGVK